MKTNKGLSSVALILVIIAVLVIGGFVYNAKKDSNPKNIIVSMTLPTPYISAQDNWPPLIHNYGTVYSCTPATSEMGKTDERIIGGRTYCVTTESEGAAGSTYSTYTYTTVSGSGTKATNFTLRYVQCENYSDPERTECEKAQSNFNIDAIVDSLM